MKSWACVRGWLSGLLMLGAMTGLVACGGSGDGSNTVLSGEGENCTKTGDCESGLKCVGLVCVDGNKPGGEDVRGADDSGGCEPDCSGIVCGDGGCPDQQNVCGTCGDGKTCDVGQCVEAPCELDCLGMECGNGGCEDQPDACGICSEGYTCEGGQCEAEGPECPADKECTGLVCGPDPVCEESCGTCSGQDECIDGNCVCQPACDGKQCGDDGCGVDCGTCPGAQDECIESACICQPACNGKECGADGCDGVCGQCDEHFACEDGGCVFQPWCGDGECDAGLAEDCDSCPADCTCGCGEICDLGSCSFLACKGKVCGSDGCGGTCGTCGCGEVCTGGQCDFTACDGKLCGDDGCGGTCGACGCGELCANGQCNFTACDGKECGDDGCGGTCGTCQPEEYCEAGTCLPFCGNGLCDNGETCKSCPGDCGLCCGNGECDNGENSSTCPVDCLSWVSIPGGNFVMGCSPGDACAVFEEPEHGVIVAPFDITETEITEGQFEAVMGYNPSCNVGGGGGSDEPVECVTWPDAQDCCEAIGGRLCTEAEWEYAARGATTTKYYCGDSSSCVSGIGWHSGNSSGHKHPVKQKTPNGYGIYDMAGNVWEWVADCWHDSYDGAPSVSQPVWDYDCDDIDRVFRGGSFYNSVGSLRHSTRNAVDVPDPYAYSDPTVGVRCCKSLCGNGQCGAGETCANCPGDCGQCWTQESFVPAGNFWMGCNVAVDSQCDDDEYPYHQVYLSAYHIDRTEVTVQAYAACVAAGACTVPSTSSSNHNWGVPGREDHPVNQVSWYQAQTYCTWAGKRLPTEAEWEKAARWTDGRKYPWGNEKATCQYAVVNAGGNTSCGTDSTWPVCSRSPAGDSHYGVCDMAGNVWEWTADWYSSGYYDQSPASNPKGPTSGSGRVLRGGSLGIIYYSLRVSNRYYDDPSGGPGSCGFRCARSE